MTKSRKNFSLKIPKMVKIEKGLDTRTNHQKIKF